VTRRAAGPQLLVLASVASTQFGAAFADKLFDRAGPSGVVLMRLGFAAILLCAFTRPTLRGHGRGGWCTLVLFGLVLGTMNWTFYESLNRLPLGVAVTVEFIGPLTVAVIGSRRRLDLLWVACAAAGVVLLALDHSKGTIDGVGLLYALAAGTCWGLYIILAKRAGSVLPGVQALAIALVVGSLLVLPAGLISAGGQLTHPGLLASGLLVALMSSVIPYSFELIALRRLAAATFGLLMSIEPAVAALAGVIVLGELVRARLIIALVLVVAASVGTTVAGQREPALGTDAGATSLIHPD
jgi:inner membrane transporter RhtA